jgi:tellurite resistance protein TehA-like permease
MAVAIVASEVAAVTGGLLAPHLTVSTALTVLVASYILWACSVPLALGILAMLFLRLAIHKLPPANMAATSWLALGPIGTGALVTGAAAPAILTANGLGCYGPLPRV